MPNLNEFLSTANVPSAQLLEFTGEDRLTWLHSQVTQDLANLQPGQTASFCICRPNGRLLTVGELLVLPDSVVAAVPTATVAAVMERVEEAVILEDVGVRELAAGVEDRERIALLEAGIPVWGEDMDENTLPQELGTAFEARHLAYGKGCYPGQEIHARLHSRGEAAKLWVGLLAQSALTQSQVVRHGAAEMGMVTSAGSSRSLGFIAAAVLRKDAAKEGEMLSVITATAIVRAEVRHMPLLRQP